MIIPSRCIIFGKNPKDYADLVDLVAQLDAWYPPDGGPVSEAIAEFKAYLASPDSPVLASVAGTLRTGAHGLSVYFPTFECSPQYDKMGLAHLGWHDLLLKFSSGVTGRILTSWGLRPPGGRYTLFAIMAEAGQLWGEIGKLCYQPFGFNSPAVVEFPGWSYDRTFAAEIAHFVDAVEGGFEPLHSVPEATDVLRLIVAGYQAAEESRLVKL